MEQQKQENEVLFKNNLHKQAGILSPAIFTLLTRYTNLILFEVFLNTGDTSARLMCSRIIIVHQNHNHGNTPKNNN